MDIEAELQRIYDSEINTRISWFLDGGIDVRLGDETNGFLPEETVESVSEILPWLQEAIAHFYPAFTYPASLAPEARERATQRLFRAPIVGQSIKCLHSGIPNATLMDEVFAFVRRHCGEPVK